MTIKVYHILFDEGLIAETGIKDKIEPTIEDFIKKYEKEKKFLIKELKELEEAFNDIYGPKKNDTFETYNRFVMKTYPDLYERLERTGRKILKGLHITNTFVYSNEYYGWRAIDGEGKSWLYKVSDALALLYLDVSRERFTIKEVEIEIP